MAWRNGCLWIRPDNHAIIISNLFLFYLLRIVHSWAVRPVCRRCRFYGAGSNSHRGNCGWIVVAVGDHFLRWKHSITNSIILLINVFILSISNDCTTQRAKQYIYCFLKLLLSHQPEGFPNLFGSV